MKTLNIRLRLSTLTSLASYAGQALIVTLIACNSALEAQSLVRRAAQQITPGKLTSTLFKPAHWVAQTSFYKKHPWLVNTASVLVAGFAAKKAYSWYCLHKKKQKLKKILESNGFAESAEYASDKYIRGEGLEYMTLIICTRDNIESFSSYGRALKYTQELIKGGLNVNEQSSLNGGSTPLIAAADHRIPYMIDALIACGADVNAKDGSGNTALMRACDDAYHDSPDSPKPATQTIDCLIKGNANLDVVNNVNESALMLAAKWENYRIVKRLILAGALVIPEEINKLYNKEAIWKIVAEHRQNLYTAMYDARTILGMPAPLGKLIASYLVPEIPTQQTSNLESKRQAAADADAQAGENA